MTPSDHPSPRTGVVAQQGNTGIPSGVLFRVLAVLLTVQLPANAPADAEEDGPSVWFPATHVRDQNRVPGS